MYKVIVADDEKKVIQLMKKLIDWEDLGFEIIGSANDGLTALSLVEKYQPDLLITDIRMPGCNGLELLQKSKECKPDLLCIVVSGYQEFEYARSAMKYGVEDYLLKPLNKNEMTELLNKTRIKLESGAELEYQIQLNNKRKQEMLIRKLRDCALNGVDFNSLEDINHQYGFRFVSGQSVSCLVKVDIPDAERHLQTHKILSEHVLEIVRRNIAQITDEYAAAVIPEGVAAILNSAADSFSDLKKLSYRIRKKIEQEAFEETRVTFCAGTIQRNFSDLGKSFLSAVYLCEDRLCGSGNYRDANVESPLLISNKVLEAEDRIALHEAVELLSSEDFRNALRQSYTKMINISSLNGRTIRNWYEEVIDTVIFKLVSFGVNGKKVKVELMEAFWYYDSFVELESNLENVISSLLEELRMDKEIQESKPITDAKRYIREHYREALRLEDVSNEVGFNATYFSTLFKKETGMNYQEYLTELRMAKAKELLSEGDLSPADVAEKIGYSDIKYFSRLFKKATGINPSEYKKLYS